MPDDPKIPGNPVPNPPIPCDVPEKPAEAPTEQPVPISDPQADDI